MAAAGQATYARAAEPALAYAARLAGVRGEDQAALMEFFKGPNKELFE